MIENNCSCSVLSNKIDKSIIRRYDNNKGRKRSGLDKSKLQAVEKAIESLAPQGFLPVRRAPLVRALASHAGGRRFESASLHHVVTDCASSRRLFYAAHEKVISHLLRRVSSQNRDRWRWVTILFFDLAAGQPWSPFQVNLLKSLAKGHSSW